MSRVTRKASALRYELIVCQHERASQGEANKSDALSDVFRFHTDKVPLKSAESLEHGDNPTLQSDTWLSGEIKWPGESKQGVRNHCEIVKLHKTYCQTKKWLFSVDWGLTGT